MMLNLRIWQKGYFLTHIKVDLHLILCTPGLMHKPASSFFHLKKIFELRLIRGRRYRLLESLSNQRFWATDGNRK